MQWIWHVGLVWWWEKRDSHGGERKRSAAFGRIGMNRGVQSREGMGCLGYTEEGLFRPKAG